MISKKAAVCAALEGVCGEVVFGYPRDFTGESLVCWRESGNRSYAQADGREHLAELEYTLELFAPSAGEAWALLEESDGRMCALGFRRESAAEIFEQESEICRVSARYRALADEKGNLYQ